VRYRFAKKLPLFLSLAIGCLFLGCSNSEGVDQEIIANWNIAEDATPLSSKIDYLPLDDSEYPYAGLPRIVIETENHREIKDRETEIPAKLQVWGEKSPESEVMDLTIRGRGNSTWNYPKKPYAIKFNEKQSFLDMPKAKKWVMLANYKDRTLIRNAVAFELARHTSLKWTPSGKFADVFLNGKFLGNYYICEKIEVKKNRLEQSDKSFLLEFDSHYDEEFKFRTKYNDFPVNIKFPSEPDSSQIHYIKNYVDSAEYALQQDPNDTSYLAYINQKSFADFFLVNELTTNTEMSHPKSIFIHKEHDEKIEAGPVWDFDYDTFNINKNGLTNKNTIFFKQFWQKKSFRKVFYDQWILNKIQFIAIEHFIDSLSTYIDKSNQVNAELWPIHKAKYNVGDETKSFPEAIEMLKKSLTKKANELDSLLDSQQKGLQ